MTELILWVQERPDRDSRFLAFTQEHGQLVTDSRQPFLDAAHELLIRGVSPNTRLICRHVGSSTDSLKAPVGEAARWMVEEGQKGGPRFRPYRPHYRSEG